MTKGLVDLGELFNRLLPYNPDYRTVEWNSSYGSGVGARNLTDLAIAIRALLASVYKCSEISICTELGEWAKHRAIVSLLPHECLFSNPLEDKPLIRDHLLNLGLPGNESLVSAIKVVCENFRNARSGGKKTKTGIEDVHVWHPHLYNAIWDRQRGRCNYCGVKLIRGENVELDHVAPHHLGDDPSDGSNWCFSCRLCNGGKGSLAYYSLSDISITRLLSVSPTLTPVLRFAVLARDKSCASCGSTPTVTELCIKKIIPTGCWILDNAKAVCKENCSPLE